jgi:hypothetical protein
MLQGVWQPLLAEPSELGFQVLARKRLGVLG